jgi:hypothetical protein
MKNLTAHYHSVLAKRQTTFCRNSTVSIEKSVFIIHKKALRTGLFWHAISNNASKY